MELAVMTSTAPAHWRDEDDATLATALDVLRVQSEQIRGA